MITEKQFKIAIITLFLCIVGMLYLTRDVPTEKPEIRNTFNELIEKGEFPHYKLADSLYGEDSRGTDIWCETAYAKVHDYQIDIHNDTVWLYNEEEVLIVKGDFDSLAKYIEYDNL